jgi:hypothetical protein
VTPAEATSKRITELVGPYLRVERSPNEGWIRIWFGPHDCWLDMNQARFDEALRREPLPVDAEGRILWDDAR